jgi:FdhD protein
MTTGLEHSPGSDISGFKGTRHLRSGNPERGAETAQPVKIQESNLAKMSRIYPCIRGDRGSFSEGTHPVIEEAAVTVNVNGRHAMTAMTSPVNLDEFVTGILYTEKIIKTADEIESIRVEKNIVSVITKNPFSVIGQKKVILSGCGGDSSFTDVKHLPKITSDLVLSYSGIIEGVKKVLESELHRITGGIHTVGLVNRDGSVSTAEDIGRHNALDRVIGRSIRQGVDLSGTFAVLSGRISSEMIRKCLIANIPVIVSRGATTSLSLDVAEQTGLTVIGFVRAGKMIIYTHPDRITGAPEIQSVNTPVK